MKRKELLLRLRKALVQRRDGLRRNLAMHQQFLMGGERDVGDSADAALDAEQDELDSQLASAESRELQAINAALQRFQDGEYGVCLGCEKPIPTARLTALPYATLCIDCKRREERESSLERAGIESPPIADWNGDRLLNVGLETA